MTPHEELVGERQVTARELHSLYEETLSCLHQYGRPIKGNIFFPYPIFREDLVIDASILGKVVPEAQQTLEISNSLAISVTTPVVEGVFPQCTYYIRRSHPDADWSQTDNYDTDFRVGYFGGDTQLLGSHRIVPPYRPQNMEEIEERFGQERANAALAAEMGADRITVREHAALTEIIRNADKAISLMKRQRLMLLLRHPLEFLRTA